MRARRSASDHERQFAAFARSIPLLDALEQAGETYILGGYGKLKGALNAWAHDPDGGRFVAERVLPLDPRDRGPAVADALAAPLESAGDEPVCVVVRSEAIALSLHPSQIMRFLAELIDSGAGAAMAFVLPDGSMLEVRRGQLAWGRLA